MKPSLALCIPAYNAAETLPRLLTSAQGQSVPFDEIWVHDDASSDDTAGIARSFGAQVVRSESNRGCSTGKDILLGHCVSDFVHFHDADDDLTPDFVSTARRWMTAADAVDVVLFGYEYRDGRSDHLLGTRCFDDAALRADPIAYCIQTSIVAICGLYRTESVVRNGGYRIPDCQLLNEDQSFHCRLARAGLRFRADPGVTVINFRYSGSMSDASRAGCAAAQYEVMAESARLSDARYFPLIASRLWQISAVAASLDDWATADAAVLLARSLDPRGPAEGHPAYQWLSRRAPRLATRLRRMAIDLRRRNR